MANAWYICEHHLAVNNSGAFCHVPVEDVFNHDGQASAMPTIFDKDGNQVGLRLSSIGTPIKLKITLDSSGKNICLCPYVLRRKKELAVDFVDGKILEYSVNGAECFPVTGNVDIINNLLSEIMIENNGVISFKDFLTLKKRIDAAQLREVENEVTLSSKDLLHVVGQAAPGKGLKATLYPYQSDGFRWMSFMLEQGCGCILGDEMGLGKTLQVISVITALASGKRTHVLVVCPVSLLENWKRECAKFSPDLDVYLHHGSRRTGIYRELLEHDVVIISYNTAVSDLGMLKMINWDLVVIDEAQNIKNYSSTRAVSVKKIPKEAGIAITGTPFENHITDIWSIVDYVMPGYMGDIGTFKKTYDDSISAADEIEPMLSPIMLRRLVSDVAKDLPEKVVIEQPIIMPEAEGIAYERYRLEACGAPDSEKIGLGVLQKLRMFCTHPSLCEDAFIDVDGDYETNSLKYQRMCEITQEIVDSNEKVIVFTSYKKMFDIFASDVPTRYGIPVWAINGETPVDERQRIVDAFNSHEGSAFLALNPRAAGTGLNITGANHVIHYNPEWNPALEDQASARAYRRGQTKTVFVYRLYYSDTVEEVVNERIKRKRQLAEHAVIGNTGDTDSRQDIIRALQVSPLHRIKEDAPNE